MHLKRTSAGKFWPIERKGTKYLAVASHNQTNSIPLVIVMRDILKLVKNKKELNKLINEKQILINQNEIRDVHFPIGLFDILSLNKIKKNYQSVLAENKKVTFKEIPEKEAEYKVYKIINKKVISKNKIQLNLESGMNILSNEKAKTGDSAVLNLKTNKITKILSMEKGKKAFVAKGKHAGVIGEIKEIIERGGKKIAKISVKDKKINVWIKNILIIE